MKRLFQQIKRIASFWYVFMHDSIYYAKYSLNGYSLNCKNDCMKAQMMLLLHALEKGMSFAYKKQDWGEKKAFALCKTIREYAKNNDIDEYMILAISVLQKYSMDSSASKKQNLIADINALVKTYSQYLFPQESVGIRKIQEPPAFDKKQIEDFFSTRFSVRDFSNEPITKEEITSAMKIANLTPTACNRQTSKVYAIRNKDILKEVINHQAGGQGWCENADTLFLITGNQSFFGGIWEREQIFIDGGLFAMNFVWGLHLNHIASCFKMFVRDISMQKKLNKLLDLPKNEVPIVVILAGHYKQEPVLGPYSHRFNHQCIYIDGKQQ